MKLSEQAVDEIRSDAKKHGLKNAKRLAEKFNCSITSIRSIMLNLSRVDESYIPPSTKAEKHVEFDYHFSKEMRSRGFTIEQTAALEARFSKRKKPFSYSRCRELLKRGDLAVQREREEFERPRPQPNEQYQEYHFYN